ncbi:MAG: hypothetical protein MHPSP_001426, partial [Paramarteilia canceri]
TVIVERICKNILSNPVLPTLVVDLTTTRIDGLYVQFYDFSGELLNDFDHNHYNNFDAILFIFKNIHELSSSLRSMSTLYKAFSFDKVIMKKKTLFVFNRTLINHSVDELEAFQSFALKANATIIDKDPMTVEGLKQLIYNFSLKGFFDCIKKPTSNENFQTNEAFYFPHDQKQSKVVMKAKIKEKKLPKLSNMGIITE